VAGDVEERGQRLGGLARILLTHAFGGRVERVDDDDVEVVHREGRPRVPVGERRRLIPVDDLEAGEVLRSARPEPPLDLAPRVVAVDQEDAQAAGGGPDQQHVHDVGLAQPAGGKPLSHDAASEEALVLVEERRVGLLGFEVVRDRADGVTGRAPPGPAVLVRADPEESHEREDTRDTKEAPRAARCACARSAPSPPAPPGARAGAGGSNPLAGPRWRSGGADARGLNRPSSRATHTISKSSPRCRRSRPPSPRCR
jgi:hypothetical protein